jgi:glutamate synthase (NADPH/NADH) small chain
MPGSQREVLNAMEEGIEFNWLTLPIKYIGDRNIEMVKVVKMQLGSPDETGRRCPEQVPGSDYEIKSDLIIEALGFDPENIPLLFNEPDLEVTKFGTIKINFKTMMTKIDGVFAAGDIVRGASLVVWGIKDGRDAANNLHIYLKEKNPKFAKMYHQKTSYAT